MQVIDIFYLNTEVLMRSEGLAVMILLRGCKTVVDLVCVSICI